MGGLAILDPSTAPGGTLELLDVHELIAERLPLLPPMRWRLAEVPFGLDYPYWVDDPDFDLDFHVRELALPPPGTDEKLAEQVARIVARPLDRARPLWELYLIHGLEHGHVAMLTKIHHALIDGLSGAEIMGVLLRPRPEGRELPSDGDPRAATQPSELEMLARGLLGLPALPAAHPARAARRAAEPRRDGVQHAARRRDRRPGVRARAARAPRPARGRRTRARQPAPRRRPRSTAASRRTGASPSASSPSTRSRRSRTTTAARSTTWSSRSARAPSAAGW